MGFENLGKILIALAVILLVIGGILLFISRFGIFRLPGDIYIKKGNFAFYFPIVTCIVISVIISLIALVINRIR